MATVNGVIKPLYSKAKGLLFPWTLTSAVFNENGESVDSLLNDFSTEISTKANTALVYNYSKPLSYGSTSSISWTSTDFLLTKDELNHVDFQGIFSLSGTISGNTHYILGYLQESVRPVYTVYVMGAMAGTGSPCQITIDPSGSIDFYTPWFTSSETISNPSVRISSGWRIT